MFCWTWGRSLHDGSHSLSLHDGGHSLGRHVEALGPQHHGALRPQDVHQRVSGAEEGHPGG